MKHLLLAAALALAAGCSPQEVEPATAAWTVADVAGHYGQSGHIGFLELEESGTYECFVINGLTMDGCGTFEGAGMSRGAWVLEGGSVAFRPEAESAGLVVRLSDASAVPSAAGLVLSIDGVEHLLVRSADLADPADEVMPPGAPSDRR